MRVCMIGAGYVGLVSAVCFSEFGWSVSCNDTDPKKIEGLGRLELPIYEPGLDELLQRNVSAGRLEFSTGLSEAVAHADVVFLAVGTSMRRGDGHADLTYVFTATEQIASHLSGYTVVATKSTVPVGTSRRIEEILRGANPQADFSVCSNPEFLREGSAIEDFMRPDRVLVGCDSERAEVVMRRLYQPLSLREAPIIVTTRETAELSKYAANAFLAMKISFINEVSSLCERVGADVQDLARAIGKDRRIGDKFLHPGPGYGGSCFPKDVAALVRSGREHQSPLTLIECVQHINEERKMEMPRRVRSALGGDVRGKTIGVLGVTFKPNTDDMREAPSLTILPVLAGEGAKIRVYDPQGRNHGEGLLGFAEWCTDAMSVSDNADAVLLLTEWNEFRALDLSEIARRMKGSVLLDLRNVFRPEAARAAGLTYHGIGRGHTPTEPETQEHEEHRAANHRWGKRDRASSIYDVGYWWLIISLAWMRMLLIRGSARAHLLRASRPVRKSWRTSSQCVGEIPEPPWFSLLMRPCGTSTVMAKSRTRSLSTLSWR